MYRGVHGAYWALADGAPHACGVTVHLVDAGIDTGGILEQALIRPTARDNFVTYPLLQTAAALPLLQRVIRRGLKGALVVQPNPEGKSALRSHPTLLEYFWRCARDCVK
jgi:methionyl-tRNA formyltransferase